VKKELPNNTLWSDRWCTRYLATFAKYCWAFPFYYVDYVKKDIAEMVDMLMEDLDLAVRARGENSLPESPISRWYKMGGSDVVMFYMFRDHLTWRGHMYTTKAKGLRWNDVEKRPMLPLEDNKQAKKVWEQLETRQAAERVRDETLNAVLKREERRRLEREPARVAPKRPNPESGRKSTSNDISKPSRPKGKSTSTAKEPTTKLQRQVTSPQTVAGPGHSATPIQSFAGPSSSAPVPQLSAQPWNLPTPEWASTYQLGMLPFLGLEVGKYGKEGTDVIVPPNKMGRPGKPGNPVESKAFSWNWGIYTLLAKIPGGKAKMSVLHQMCQEWCPVLKVEGSDTPYKSCRHALTSKCTHFFLTPDDSPGSKGGWWDLSDIGVGEQRKRQAGPPPRVNPRTNWGTAKAPSDSSQMEDEDDDKAMPEEPSMTDPVYGINPGNFPQTRNSVSSKQGRQWKSFDDVDAFLAATAPVSPAQTSTAGSSSPQNSAGNTVSPISSPADSQEAERQWTPVNRTASVSLVHRTPPPSGLAKRKAVTKEDNDSEQPTLKRQRSL